MTYDVSAAVGEEALALNLLVGVSVFQAMGTPKRAVPSLTAVQPQMQRRASSMMARIWLCLR